VRFGAGGRRAAAPRRRRAAPTTARLRLPESLLARLAQSGTRERAAPSGERTWGPLEAAVHACVFAALPSSARRVRLAWDAARGEVVASFERDPLGRGRRPRHGD
jgi:hypothetical protein